MHRPVVSMALLALLSALNSSVPLRGEEQQKQQKNQPKNKVESLTGCIDEQDGRYVLLNDRTRATVADLEPEGFPVEAFAKHLGHKVTVRGTSNPAADRPLFRVRSIETVSDTCEPQALK